MKEFFTYRGAVQTWECDSNGHMNVMYYINKYELAGRLFLQHIGLSQKALKVENWGIAVVKQEVNYLQEVFEDELLTVKSSLRKHSNKTITVHHEMINLESSKTVGTADITIVVMDQKKRKAVAIPSEVKKQINLLTASK